MCMKKKALITGGTSSLGIKTIEEFAKAGYDIIFTFNSNEVKAKKIIESIKTNYDINIECKRLDLQRENDIIALFDGIESLDCLVNNAAYNNDCDILEHTKDEFVKTLEVNLVGPFLMSKYAYKLLSKSNGNIINVASSNGIDSMYPESVDYDASKSALINMTKNLMKAFSPLVRVNAIAPGWIETTKTEDMNPNFRESEINKIALKRFAMPEEIAKTIIFLASDDASYINGSIISVDGGRL